MAAATHNTGAALTSLTASTRKKFLEDCHTIFGPIDPTVLPDSTLSRIETEAESHTVTEMIDELVRMAAEKGAVLAVPDRAKVRSVLLEGIKIFVANTATPSNPTATAPPPTPPSVPTSNQGPLEDALGKLGLEKADRDRITRAGFQTLDQVQALEPDLEKELGLTVLGRTMLRKARKKNQSPSVPKEGGRDDVSCRPCRLPFHTTTHPRT